MKRRTYRGRTIDMDEIRMKHEDTVAAGNMRTNAKGDTLGQGGAVSEPVQRKAKKHYRNTKKTEAKVTLKGENTEESVFADEKPLPTKSTKPARKAKAKVEKVNDNGDITLEDEK